MEGQKQDLIQEIQIFLNENYEFDIKNTKLQKINGYETFNFKITHNNQDYLLKIYPENKDYLNQISVETRILVQLNDQKQNFYSNPIKSIKNEYYSIKNNKIFRLLTFLQGNLLSKQEITSNQLLEIGQQAGEMDIILKDISCQEIKDQQINWDLQHFLLNKKYLDHIEDSQKKSMVELFIKQYEDHIQSKHLTLRKQLIHNDLNEQNILVGQDQSISGFLDFGDLSYSQLVNELAINCAYMAMFNLENPLENILPVLKGFHQKIPLLAEEIDVLYYLIGARLCTSVLNSSYAFSQDPSNIYIISSQKLAFDLMEQMIKINPLEFQKKIKEELKL